MVVVVAVLVSTTMPTKSNAYSFKGTMTVEGAEGSTTVVGTGNSHSYCSTGRPRTSAAGKLTDSITLTVGPAECTDAGATGPSQFPAGVYEVRYNNEPGWFYDGTYWVPNTPPAQECFHAANAATVTVIGTFHIDSAGYGSWTGKLAVAGPPSFASLITASTLCIGKPTVGGNSDGFSGMFAPFRLLADGGVASAMAVSPKDPRAGDDINVLGTGLKPNTKYKLRFIDAVALAAARACLTDGIDIGPHDYGTEPTDEHDVTSDAAGVVDVITTIPESVAEGVGEVCFDRQEGLEPVPAEDGRPSRRISVRPKGGCSAVGEGGLMEQFPYEEPYQGCERHHMPSKGAYKGHLMYRQECGPVIIMESADHKLTRSYGRNSTAIGYRTAQKRLIDSTPHNDEGFAAAFDGDWIDVSSKFGAKYAGGVANARLAMQQRMTECNVRRAFGLRRGS